MSISLPVIARSASDEAIQSLTRDSGLLRFARNDDHRRSSPYLPHTNSPDQSRRRAHRTDNN
jgi:hypothetical protein